MKGYRLTVLGVWSNLAQKTILFTSIQQWQSCDLVWIQILKETHLWLFLMIIYMHVHIKFKISKILGGVPLPGFLLNILDFIFINSPMNIIIACIKPSMTPEKPLLRSRGKALDVQRTKSRLWVPLLDAWVHQTSVMSWQLVGPIYPILWAHKCVIIYIFTDSWKNSHYSIDTRKLYVCGSFYVQSTEYIGCKF